LPAFVLFLACNSDPTSPGVQVTDRDGEIADADTDAAAAAFDALAPALVEVSGRVVELAEGGTGAATVVFEAGLGSDWSTWEPVAQEVAGRARVFVYSRPGYGSSASSTSPRTPTRIVDDLRALLVARHLAPPYVLVGHSFGGTYMELFAKAHPEEVVGLVLVDPRHRDFTAACQTAGLDGCTIPASVLGSLPEVEQAEIEAFAKIADEIRAAGTFGPAPVRVLTATLHGFAPEVEALWQSMLGGLADEAPHGEQIMFTGAGHLLQEERPHEVAEAIFGVLHAGSATQ
jgi:pimeloyl-ACP methyl ester carboxylesterase